MSDRENLDRAIRDGLEVTAEMIRDFASGFVFKPADPQKTAEMVKSTTLKMLAEFLKDRGIGPERCPKIESRYEDGKVHLHFVSDDHEIMQLIHETFAH